MNMRRIVSNMVVKGRHLAAPETANLRMTPGLGLALYLFAVGLTEVFSEEKSRKRAIELATKLWQQLDMDGLRKIGFNTRFLANVSTWSKLVTHVAHFRDVIKVEYTNNPDASHEEAKFLAFAGLFFQSPTKPNYVKRMMVAVASLGPTYAAMFSKAVFGKTNHDTGSVLQSQIKNLVKAVTGKNSTKLSTELLKQMREGSPTDVSRAKQYAKLRTDIRRQMIIDFTAFLDKNGGKHVSVAEANEFLYDSGYDEPLFPEVPSNAPLYVGVEGGKPAYFTKDGRRLVGNIPANAIAITFMKTYNSSNGTGGYLSYRTPEAKGETPTKLYTVEHKNSATEKKFSVAAEVADNMMKYVSKWKKDLTSRDSDKFMSATAAILIYLTGMRVGASVSARAISGKATTGALTLTGSNIAITGDMLTVKYTGKKGMAQKHVIKLDKTIPVGFKSALKELLVGKGPKDYVFSVEDEKKGRLVKLPYTTFTTYLKATGFPAGIHKIRHARGTALMVEKIETLRFKFPSTANTLAKKQKYAEDFAKDKILTPVAHLLGHKKASGEPLWSTSIQNYCNPAPLAQWFIGNELRVPKWIPKKIIE